MKVVLRHPRREIDIEGPTTVRALLEHLDIVLETVLVIRGNDLLTRDQRLAADDTVELRPVISGG
ncbi:MAG: thiamine biosynthesis protein ThiS [Gammaproteobacteria bacterium]|nr:thiamine biosynthesis protein ThiS [Gammaproteobacteria bacterium]